MGATIILLVVIRKMELRKVKCPRSLEVTQDLSLGAWLPSPALSLCAVLPLPEQARPLPPRRQHATLLVVADFLSSHFACPRATPSLQSPSPPFFLHPGEKAPASPPLPPSSPALLPGFMCLSRARLPPGQPPPRHWPSQGLIAWGLQGVLSTCYLIEGIILAPPASHFLLLALPLALVQSSQHPRSGPLPPVQVPGLLQAGGASEAGLGAAMQPQCHAVGAWGENGATSLRPPWVPDKEPFSDAQNQHVPVKAYLSLWK